MQVRAFAHRVLLPGKFIGEATVDWSAVPIGEGFTATLLDKSGSNPVGEVTFTVGSKEAAHATGVGAGLCKLVKSQHAAVRMPILQSLLALPVRSAGTQLRSYAVFRASGIRVEACMPWSAGGTGAAAAFHDPRAQASTAGYSGGGATAYPAESKHKVGPPTIRGNRR